MKNQKLKLNELKVKSFTTEVLGTSQRAVNGGSRRTNNIACPYETQPFVCDIAPPNYTNNLDCHTNPVECRTQNRELCG